jgi:hypothetical protein
MIIGRLSITHRLVYASHKRSPGVMNGSDEKHRGHMKTFIMIAVAFLTCASGAEALQESLNGKVMVPDHVAKFSFVEREGDLEFNLIIQGPFKDPFWNPKVQVWVLNTNGSCLRQIEGPKRGMTYMHFTHVKFITIFEKIPIKDIVGGVVEIGGKLVFFEAWPNADDKMTPTRDVERRFGQPPPHFAEKKPAPRRPFPDGMYLVNLEWWKQKQTLTLKVEGNKGEVVKSSDPRLQGCKGEFKDSDDEGFQFYLNNEVAGGQSQIWRPQSDDSFIIKEVPDRGENERAVKLSRNL